ncbi:MAG TPA: phosphoribosylformylglycinamidine synthase I, partial [Clostridia bacterium]|nr:phosphoribosylformylglycinamidine synthase I [Clostridia bacterium]
MRPKVCVLRTDGTNGDEETKFAFELAGAEACLVHINQLKRGREGLENYGMLVIPGGFSYGDDVSSGKILALELMAFLKEELEEFAGSGKPILGIGNGFQVLLKTNLLPGKGFDNRSATLTGNRSGDFECRWVRLVVEESNCVFTKGMENEIVEMQVAHGEGQFFAEGGDLDDLERKGRVVLRYVDGSDTVTTAHPFNPDGSVNSIAGICDETGRIFGMMPYPERFVTTEQHPNWR